MIKKSMLVTVAGLALVSAGASYAGKTDDIEQAVSARQAIDIALSSMPGQIHELELEREDDIVAWEVELVSSKDGKEYEILIDATTGEVIEVEMEDDDWTLFGSKSQD